MVEEEEEVEVFDEGVRDGVEEGIGNLGEIAEPEDERRAEEGVDEMPGIRVTSPVDRAKRPGVIFVLEKACLEVGKVGKNFQILNSDDHANYLRKQNRNPADYRPDIIHQIRSWKALPCNFLTHNHSSPDVLLRLLHEAVYVKTEKGVLFEIKPYVRIPSTFKRFCGLMSQSLQKSSIIAVGKPEKLVCHKEFCDSPFACQFQEISFRIPSECGMLLQQDRLFSHIISG
ncbi:uncharacterized protein LOC103983473 isoform X2 [Musa acuminata AAA Group]|uniref:uncharacterized protein LOC103983473 isoform X2 n=1 Tax=Musa acuminata AAA Group TaxID=214697 RepID=UPI0031DB3E07